MDIAAELDRPILVGKGRPVQQVNRDRLRQRDGPVDRSFRIQRAQQGRTTLLITHRLSQIRWADHILVIEKGKVVASGTHEDLLRTSAPYRRIFARYDVALPPLEEKVLSTEY